MEADQFRENLSNYYDIMLGGPDIHASATWQRSLYDLDGEFSRASAQNCNLLNDPSCSTGPQRLTRDSNCIRRMTLGATLSDVLGRDGDSIIPVFLPARVVERCNGFIADAAKDRGLPHLEPSLSPAIKSDQLRQAEEDAESVGQEYLIPTFWHIDAVRAWQLIDRRIDE